MVIESTAKMNLNADLLTSMALVGFGFVLGLGAAMLVVWLNGRGQVRKTPSFRRISRSTPTRGPHP